MAKKKTKAQREAASKRQKQYWERVRKIAVQIGVNAQEVSRSWQKVNDHSIAEALDAGDKKALGMLKRWIETRLGEERTHFPPPNHGIAIVSPARRRRSTYRPPEEVVDGVDDQSVLDRLQIMGWAIRKCGGVERASVAFEAVRAALRHERAK